MEAQQPRSSRYDRLVWIGVTVVAAVLLIAAASDQPWLDELWSRGLAEHVTSPLQIVTSNDFHIDNNHWLNTLYLYALGKRAAWYPYRLLSVASGIGLVAMTWPIARRWGRPAAWAAAVLPTCSFIFVEYGSEARGYAPAAFFAVVALWAPVRFVHGGRGRLLAGVVFNAACVLGFLAHASFLYAFVGAAVYAPVALFRRGRRSTALLLDLLALFALPLVFLAWLYAVAIAPMRVGGGPHVPMDRVLADTFAFTLGLPVGPAALWIGLVVTAAVVGYGVYALVRRGYDEWIFCVAAGVVAPVLVVLIRQPQPMYPRYLFVALPFLLLLAAAGLGDLLQRGRTGAIGGSLLLAAFVAGNAAHLWRFYEAGRGENLQAVQYLADHTAGPDITLSAAQKFRMAIVFEYFTPRADVHGKAFKYVPPQNPNAPEWFLVDAGSDDVVPANLHIGTWPNGYTRVAVFPHYGLSGSDWHIFRRDRDSD